MNGNTNNDAVKWSSFSGSFASQTSSNISVKSVVGQSVVSGAKEGDTVIESGFLPGVIQLSDYTLSIANEELFPSVFSINQNFPNPFNPKTTILYNLPEQTHVTIIIIDLLGRQVRTLINQTQDVGFKSIIWDTTNDYGKPVSAGVYLYQIQAGQFVKTKKMVLLK